MSIKSRERVQIFGEVFTPPLFVDKMIRYENFFPHVLNIHTKIFEPTFGEGIFLTEILKHRLEICHNEDDILTALANLYGVEFQADNVQTARANLHKILDEKISNAELLKKIIDANFLQGDFLTHKKVDGNIIFFRNWQIPSGNFKTFTLAMLINKRATNPTFDFERNDIQMTDDELKDFVIIGNPPYQEDPKGDNQNYAKPIYHKFLQEAYKVADEVIMVHPARCLFNAGGTPKEFNENLLSDPHVKVAMYEPDSSKVFSDVDIKGGVAVTYRNAKKNFGAIDTFTPFEELNSILHKVINREDFKPFSKIVYTPVAYRLSKKFFNDCPELIPKLQKPDDSALRTNIFNRLEEIFFYDKPNDGNDYIKILGRQDNERIYKWARRDFISDDGLIDKYKIFLPKANGNGEFGETLSNPVVEMPFVGATQTFVTIGAFDTIEETEAAMKYIKTKFARAMLGVLKVTQDNPPAMWAKVPLQNFRADSDINWKASVAAIDRRLYDKYKLTPFEIAFIESHVKAMK